MMEPKALNDAFKEGVGTIRENVSTIREDLSSAIKFDRKKFKQAGRKSFHKHFWVLFFVCIIMALFGTEAGTAVGLLRLRAPAAEGQESKSILSAADVLESITNGNISLGEQISETISKNIPAAIGGNKAIGTTNGVLAGIVNSALSGQFYVRIAESIFGATKSTTAVQIVFILVHLLVTLLLWFFVRNVYSAMARRMFLESRTYEKLPFLHILFFAYVRKWIKACWVMFVRSFYHLLWSLTIVGFFVKYYSYLLVPYIVAENPGIGANEAVTLSRKMMNGHKWEAFVFDLSFILWHLLAIVTIGISDAVYGFPYRMAAKSEYYVHLRALAKQNKIEGTEALNDIYLYQKAEKIPLYEAYFDVVDQQTLVLEKEKPLAGAKAFVLKWFSIWLGKYEEKKDYDEVEAYKYAIRQNIQCRDGLAYPVRLNPNWKESRFKVRIPFHFMRGYSVWTLILMFILFCVIGWTWEVCLYLVQDGQFYNRGFMHGPWLPIYGSGGIVVLLICSRFRAKPVIELIVSVALCGVIEYAGAVMLETKYHQRWWSYDGYFLNIDGRVCAEGLIVFGIACMLVVYLLAPLFDFLVMKLPKRVVQVIAIGLLAVFLVDFVYSRIHPNTSEGAVTKTVESGGTSNVLDIGEIPGLEQALG